MENIEALLAAVAAQTQGFDDDEPAVSTGLDVGSGISESSLGNQEVSGRTKLNYGFSCDTQPTLFVAASTPAQAAGSSASVSATGTGAKKRRGRPPKAHMANSPPQKRAKVEEEEEDVCFICFDGGSLVLCDRKGCPKAYHPVCIKRDEEFFSSKAKWNCGWHICSVCRKASHYICYTCPYSLCKGCTKDTDYLLVRGNKGFCSTCMKTIMLVEKKDNANNESIQVDFDDQTSWEYLFKMYWVCLKEKLSLTLIELEHAKKPPNPLVSVASKRRLSRVHRTVVDRSVSISCGSGESLELNKPFVQSQLIKNELSSTISYIEKQEPMRKDVPSSNTEGVSSTQLELNKPHLDSSTKQINELRTDLSTFNSHAEKVAENEAGPVQNTKLRLDKESPEPQNFTVSEWGSKDLLEFVGHVRNGDMSVMSQFDVQTLLIEYIKKNLLRDPHQKSQIICDSKLRILFGKSRVGHFEMLKLLEYHMLIKDDTLKNSVVPAGFVCSSASDTEIDENIRDPSFSLNSRKRKSNRKNEHRVPKPDSKEYAAIDIHNINLIYLRRNLAENLSLDQSDFNAKVIDSIVRIRVAANDQKQDLYRLVQVVGTTEASEPYKSGERTLKTVLEVLNLDKKELVSVDAISNQDFTEDECRRLRQSIRCGLMKQFTVGDVKKKAMELQTIKVNDWLEAETRRLNHLRDRANENGRKKELRECVEKLQLLNSPKERQRRISKVPDVHADRKMDPDYKSEDDKSGLTTKRDEDIVQRRRVSPRIKGKEELTKQEQNRRKSDIISANGSNNLDSKLSRSPGDEVSTCKLMQNSVEDTLTVANSDHIETERMWHYRDPTGKIQGPFSMMQLRQWNTTGLFPPETRIWTNHEQYDSLLLADALNGQFHSAFNLCGKTSKSEENLLAGESMISQVTNQNASTSSYALPVKNVTAESSWPRCWDLLKDSGSGDVEAPNITQPEQGTSRDELEENNSQHGVVQNNIVSNIEDLKGKRVEENARPLEIDLESRNIESVSVVVDLTAPENHHSVSPAQNTCILELLSPAPRPTINSDSDIQAEPSWSIASNLVLGGIQMSVPGEEWCGYSPTPPKTSSAHEWDDTSLVYASSSKPPEASSVANQASSSFQVPPAHNIPSWLTTHETIEFDAFGEESVSDLLAEVDAMESQGALASPISALKFAREFLDDCKDDCFSSIDEFSSAHAPLGSDVLSSTGEIQATPNTDGFDFFGQSYETKAPVYAPSEFNPMHETVGETTAPSDATEAGWGNVQGNINLFTVQGNVNLVLGGPVQGMGNLNWGTNWVNSQGTHNRSIGRDNQRKFNGERFTSTRAANEPGFGRGLPVWNRHGGGYSRPIPKGQRVCKFYESGHCKKGASCDYLHP